MKTSITDKLQRLRDGAAPRLLDLFSGCGGLSLGFHRAGCDPVGGVEIDADAARSYGWNFHRHENGWEARHAVSRDITKMKPSELLLDLDLSGRRSGCDFLVGGPPCPAFARVGRAKLREIGNHPEAYLRDKRAQLYEQYLEYVKALRPVALLMENVPDILNFGGRNLAEVICEQLEALGYDCQYTLLNAANYGVPQTRERFILIGVHSEASATIKFPSPTHKVDLPPGYQGIRRAALKHVVSLDKNACRYREPTQVPHSAAPAVTAQDALNDLPKVKGSSFRRRAQRLDGTLAFQPRRLSGYPEQMRSWPGFPPGGELRDHVTRALSERDFRLFTRLKAGDDYPAAVELAERLFDKQLRRMACPPSPRSADWFALQAEYVPPYNRETFPNRWRKMEPDAPARTLMAHLGKDTYSHIHYDSGQARTITVREAARLQSFPDGFRFKGTMSPAFRQIGNAVPPLLAFHLAKALLATIGATVADRDSLIESSNAPGRHSITRCRLTRNEVNSR